jgi:DNA-binding transcriptional regulator YhcF (GntR family)
MHEPMNDGRPIFVQIAEHIENEILEGSLAELGQVPSTNQFAAFYKINPATAAKGVNVLVNEGILFKKRGIGMFVAEHAREKLIEKRKRTFFKDYVAAMLREAEKLDITKEALIHMIEDGQK